MKNDASEVSALAGMFDEGALQQALSAHARLAESPARLFRQAAEMGALPKGKPPIPNYKPTLLQALGPVPLSLKELSFNTGIRLPHVRKTVESLARSGKAKNLAKIGAPGRYVLTTPEAKK